MFAQYDENKLEKLLNEFCLSFAIKNQQSKAPDYKTILQSISAFIVCPDWDTTAFLTKNLSRDVIPSYVIHRESYLSSKDTFSEHLINEKILDNYYLALNKSYPKVVHFCNKLLKIILIAELGSYIEGTTADGLGIAHLNFKSHYNQLDFNELIIHQITHMLLFIDDYVEPQVEASNKNIPIATTSQHKRGGNSFPLYILFHSLCVGVEILAYRLKSQTLTTPINYHPETSIAVSRCKAGFATLQENMKFFTLKGRKLLREYGDYLDEVIIRIENAA